MADALTTQPKKTESQVEEGIERTRQRVEFLPPADIYENATEVVVVADMPGVTPKAVDVTVENNVLTIRGKVDERKPEGHSLSYQEYAEGDYVRSFALSDEVNRDGIKATMNNGVLTLTLPKAGPTRKQIEVNCN